MSARRSIAARISVALVAAGPRSCTAFAAAPLWPDTPAVAAWPLSRDKTTPTDTARSRTAPMCAVLDHAFGLFFWEWEFCGIKLQAQLQVCVLVPWERHRVLTCIARRAVALSTRPDGFEHSRQAEVADGVSTDILADLLERVRRGDQLAATRRVDAVEAGRHGGRAANPQVNLGSSRGANHLDNLPAGGAAHQRIV